MNKFDKIIFALFLLSGVLLPVAIKSLTAIWAGVALLAIASLFLKDKIDMPNARNVFLAWIFFAFIAASYFWSVTPEASGKALGKTTALLIGLVAIIVWLKNTEFSEAQRNLLAKFLMGGVAVALLTGLSDHASPYFNMLAQTWGAADFSTLIGYQFELVRQTKGALGTSAILVFILAAYHWRNHKLAASFGIIAALIISLISHSQSAAIAMTLGIITFAVASISSRLAAGLIIAGLAIGIFVAVPISKHSFDNELVDSSLPAALNEAANIAPRRFIYYVYANEIEKRYFFGHGIASGHKFLPENYLDYIKQIRTMPSMQSVLKRYNEITMQPIAHPHQLFLQLIFNFGIIGAILFLLAIAQGLRYLLANTSPDSHKFYLAASAAAISRFCSAQAYGAIGR